MNRGWTKEKQLKYPEGYAKFKAATRKANLGRPRKFTEEHKNNMRNSVNSGRFKTGHWNNRKMSEKSKEKIRKAQIGNQHGRGHKITEEHRKILRESHTGSNSPMWKGGVTKISYAIRNILEYHQWRSDVFQRDEYTCQHCGQKGSIKKNRLEADHIKAFSKILSENNITTTEQAILCEELWNINNGRTLCHSCHIKTETYAGNSKRK